MNLQFAELLGDFDTPVLSPLPSLLSPSFSLHPPAPACGHLVLFLLKSNGRGLGIKCLISELTSFLGATWL